MFIFQDKVNQVNAPLFLIFGGVVLQGFIDLDVDVVALADQLGIVEEEEIVRRGGIGTRIERDTTTLQRSQ